MRPASSNCVQSLQRVEETKQSNNVGEHSKPNKNQLYIPRRLWNSKLEVYERYHITGVLLPPMHLAKAPPKEWERRVGSEGY